ncbi:hypothetical protein CHUAL_004136 [Chamberlinius hualienensis]
MKKSCRMFSHPLKQISGACQALKPALLFLFSLAWSSRMRLPVILSVSFMALDMRMRVEINVRNDSDDDDDENGEENEESVDDNYIISLN